MTAILASCYLLDVGQGTANVILLPHRRAIVIDGGPVSRKSNAVPMALLARHRTQRIERLVISHNDADHSRGAVPILNAYRDDVGLVYWLEDRDLSDIDWLQRFRGTFDKPAEARRYFQRKFRRLETDEGRQAIWNDAELGLELNLLYPGFGDNVEAKGEGEPNATSAVVELRATGGNVLFPGDATMEAFETIHSQLGRLECDVLAAAHHGGKLADWPDDSDGDGEREDLERLFGEYVSCSQVAVMSVSTKNGHGHPREAYVKAARAAGASVMCTQITGRRCCTEASKVFGLGRGLLPSKRYERVKSRTHIERTSGDFVGCAGTVKALLHEDHVHVDGMDAHAAAVDRFARTADGEPICRP